ncbi:hypothetical protein GCM10010429_36830 [Micromonospora olivasterospora]|uniref:Uncharacterized protein n=1 Tax=Micromonospora olivasterospora TaxID=1880 RepID=A0A562IA48_MICOL|nr:hypothetical protein JD77_02747 [Micromonospora olivasterospora]
MAGAGPAGRPLPVTRLELPADWRDVAAAARLLGGVGRAAPMLAAVDHRAYLLTTEPDAYGDDALPVIEV